MLNNIEIGRRLEARRLELKLTMDDVALKMGIAKSTVQRYEKGKIGKIKLPVIESFATALNVNPSWLIGKSNIMDRGVSDSSTALPYDDGVFPCLLKTYETLNTDGRQKVYERATELAELPKYQLTSATDEAQPLPRTAQADAQQYGYLHLKTTASGLPLSPDRPNSNQRVAQDIILPSPGDPSDKKENPPRD